MHQSLTLGAPSIFSTLTEEFLHGDYNTTKVSSVICYNGPVGWVLEFGVEGSRV